MPLLRYDVSVKADGKEDKIHTTDALPSAAYEDDAVVHRVAWHWHEEFELHHLLEGSLTFVVGTHTFPLKGGESLFINSQLLHGAWSDDAPSCPFHSIVFHPELIGGEERSIFMQKYVRPLQFNKSLPYMIFRPDTEWQRDITAHIEQTWELLMKQDTGYEFYVRNLLSRDILQIILHSDENRTDESGRQIRAQARIKKMLLFIEDHLTEDIAVKDIAAAAFISSTECRRCFKEILKTTPNQYLRHQRLKMAKRLLISTSLRVEEVGYLSGFRDMSYFARCFHMEYGIKPLAYRKAANEQSGG